MEDKKYIELRNILIGILKDLERAQLKKNKAIELSNAIGGTICKEMAALDNLFIQLERGILKLEQETREI